jgi:hypothetical protein
VLGKVASIVQKNLSNLQATGGGIAGLAGGLGGALFDKGKNSIQTNAAAAKILNKSPLELGDTSPMSHMKQNPYEYGTVFYPNDVQNLGTGHYMFFDILETTTVGAALGNMLPNSLKKGLNFLGADVNLKDLSAGKSAVFSSGKNIGKSRIQPTTSGINAGGGRHTRVVDSIILYTPVGLKTTYTVTHSGKETGILGDIASLGDGIARAGEIGKKIAAQVIDAATQMAGVGDYKAAQQKITGRAFNNNLEMTFEGVPMREFTFDFEFVPKNRKELDSARKIISLFKFHMHPELDPKSNDFVVPSQFQITYMYIDKQNTYIPRISKCVCTKLDLQHGDESVFSTFAGDELGAAPVYTKMSLSFSETEIMTKQKIAEGF